MQRRGKFWCEKVLMIESYEALAKNYPHEEKYRVYHATSLYKAGFYPECLKSCLSIHSAEYAQTVIW